MSKNIKYIFIIFLISIIVFTLVYIVYGWHNTDDLRYNVILISWDGVQRDHLYDCLRRGKLPNLQKFIEQNVFINLTVVMHETDTKAGHTMMLTGYIPEKTGVYSNSKYQAIPKGYTIFERLKEYYGDQNIVTIAIAGKYYNIEEILRNAKDRIDIYSVGHRDAEKVGRDIMDALNRVGDKFFFAFFHFSDPDHRGHAFGENSIEYEEGIVKCDVWLGKIIDKLAELKIYDKTLIYITTDHGFDEGGKNHFSAPDVFLATNDHKVVRNNGYQCDIAPTIYDVLGIDYKSFNPPLDGESLHKDVELSLLKVADGKIVDENGVEIRLKGFFIEGWLGGYYWRYLPSIHPYIDNVEIEKLFTEIYGRRKVKKIFNSFRENFFTIHDVENISKMGFNLIRVSLNYWLFTEDRADFNQYTEGFRRLDELFYWCERYKVYVVLEMHATPGGHSTSPWSGGLGKNNFWGNRDYQEIVVRLWKMIAYRYRDKKCLFGYDLINEPMPPNNKILTEVYLNIMKGILEVDRNHVFIIEGNPDIMQLLNVSDQIVLSYHFYTPVEFCLHNGRYDFTLKYPGYIGGKYWDRKALKESMKYMNYFSKKYNLPVFIGEFGAGLGSGESALRWVNDTVSLFEEYGFHWTYTVYKSPYPDMCGLYYLPEDSPWTMMLNNISNMVCEKYKNITEIRKEELIEIINTINIRNIIKLTKYLRTEEHLIHKELLNILKQ